MSRIFLPPSPRTQLPQQPTQVRGDLPKPTSLFLAGVGLVDPVTGTRFSQSGGTFGAGPGGKSYAVTAASSSYVQLSGNPSLLFPDLSNGTIVVYHRKLDTTNRVSTPFGYHFSSTNRVTAHAPYSDGTVYFDWGNTSTGRISVASLAFNTQPDCFVFVASATRGMEIWRNGKLVASNANTNARTLNTASPFRIGATQAAFSDFEENYLTATFPEDLTQDQCMRISAQPWYIFQPQSRPFYFNTGSGTQALTPGLFVNSNTFHAATVAPGAVALTPALYTDSDTFYAPTVSLGGGPQDLDPALFVNSNSFHAPTVAGSNSITPSLFSNSNAFHNAMVAPGAVDLAPSLYADTDSFYSATVSAGGNLSPSLYVNANSFHAATVSPGAVGLTPSLFADSDTFYSAAITNGLTLSPALYVDADSFYAPTVTPGSVALTPALYTDSDSFYAPTVSGAAVNLSPALYADTDTFYGASVAASTELQPILVINANSFYIPSIGRGAVNLSPALFANDQTFYTHSIGNGADEQYPLAGLTQLYPLDGLTQQYPLS